MMAETRETIAAALLDSVSLTMNKPLSELHETTELVAGLGAKSVNLVHIISAMEDVLDVEISFQKFRSKRTLGEIIDYLVELSEG
jgi:acyl carrier protein